MMRQSTVASTQGHASQGDRTGEFVLIPNRPVDKSGANRNRLPLPLGGDRPAPGRSFRVCEFRDTGYDLEPGPCADAHAPRRGRRFSRRRASRCAICPPELFLKKPIGHASARSKSIAERDVHQRPVAPPEENPTNEATDARQNATNEGTDAREIMTNQRSSGMVMRSCS